MSKGKVFVIGYSVFLMTLFCLFCFLITTVNPPPLKNGDNKNNSSRRATDMGFHTIFLNDDPVPAEKANYGLEKVNADKGFEQPFTGEPFYQIRTAIIPDKYVSNISLIKLVAPPVWPKRNSTTDILLNKAVASVKSKSYDDGSKLLIPTLIVSSSSSVKGHRRSVNNDILPNVDNDLGSMKLKVLDDYGRAKVEIKLDLNEYFKRKLEYNRNPRKSMSEFNMSIRANNSESFNSELKKSPIIKIMPNNTVVIDEDEELKEYIRDVNKVEDKNMLETGVDPAIDTMQGTKYASEKTLNSVVLFS